MSKAFTQDYILAVDLGARCQVALFGADGRLKWYQSFAIGDPEQLRRLAREVMRGEHRPSGTLAWLITRGDLNQAAVWERVAMRQGVRVQRVNTQSLQQRFFAGAGADPAPRSRAAAAEGLARRVIAWSGVVAARTPAPRATEAILVGLWGAMNLGCLRRLPQPRTATAGALN